MQRQGIYKSNSIINISLENNQLSLYAKNFTSSSNELEKTILELDLTENETRNEINSKSNQYYDLQDLKLEIDNIKVVEIPFNIIKKLGMEDFETHTISFRFIMRDGEKVTKAVLKTG